MSLIENCRIYFGANDLYEVLSVPKSASDSELKKAYRKCSLLVHPDRVEGSEKDEATRKFQILSQVYFILSDKENRTIYDETGCINEENSFPEDKDWYSYWRLLFPKLTSKDIDDFMQKYKGSEEEKENLKKCYLDSKGDMNMISETFLGYEMEDEDRYYEILNGLIKAKEIPNFAKFGKESKEKKTARSRRYKKEASEAEDLKKELKMDDTADSLMSAIAKRSRDRESQFDDMIKNLESKYVKKPSGRKKQK